MTVPNTSAASIKGVHEDHPGRPHHGEGYCGGQRPEPARPFTAISKINTISSTGILTIGAAVLRADWHGGTRSAKGLTQKSEFILNEKVIFTEAFRSDDWQPVERTTLN